MKEEFVNAFLAPAKLVWQAELNRSLEIIRSKLATTSDVPQDVTAIIGVSGRLKGYVRYEFGRGTSLAVAGAMMGETLEGHNDVSMSALGEIANMITGNAAANLFELGFTCEITPPKLYDFGASVPDDYIGLQIITLFSSELGRLNIRIGLAETSAATEVSDPFPAVSSESPLDKYSTRVQNVMGLAPAKRRR